MPRISNFSEEPGNQEKLTEGSNTPRSQKDIYMYVQYAKVSIWSSTELAEKAISAPKHQDLPQMDVEGNITLLISESKASLSDTYSSFGHHQRDMSIGRASDWHVRNTWIDDPHRESQFKNDMQKKTVQLLT